MLTNLKKIFIILSKDNKKSALFLIVVKLLSSFLDLVGVASIFPFLAIIANNELINNNKYIFIIKDFFKLKDNEIILFFGLTSLLLILITLFFRIFSIFYEKNTISKIWLSLHQNLFNYYLQQTYSFHLHNNSTQLQEKIQIQINSLANGFIGPFLIIVGNLFSTIFMFGLLLFVNLKVTLIFIIIFIFYYFFINLLFKKKIYDIGKFSPIYSSRTFRITDQAFKSIKEIIINGNYKFYYRKFSDLANQYQKNQIKLSVYSGIPRVIIECIFFILIFCFIFYIENINKSLITFVPTAIVFILSFQKIIPSVQSIYQQLAEIKYFKPAFDLVYPDAEKSIKFFKKSKKNKNEDNKINFNNNIKLENIKFYYDKEQKFKIKIPYIEIKKNSFVGIVGETGSGKTTFIDILIGLHTSFEGNLFVDNIMINEDNKFSWFNLLSYTPQNIYLADDTIIKNIALGVEDENIDFERIKYATKFACIDKFIENELENKYETYIGEAGIRISGGQRQRLGIARAIYKNANILIFDESTNSLDVNTEVKIISNIKNLQKEKTIIMVTHNLNLLDKCDKIIYFDKQRNIHHGTLDNLRKQNTDFKELILNSKSDTRNL